MSFFKLYNHEVECELCGKDRRGLMGSSCTDFYCVTKSVYIKDGTNLGIPFKKGEKRIWNK